MGEVTYTEKNLDFDVIIDRNHTESLKYDFKKSSGMPEDVLPLWVADMDFKTSSIILDRLRERVEHGIFGYTETKKEYFEAVARWMSEKHQYEIDERWLIKTPGIVTALAMTVKAYTEVGDAVLIQQPVYYPFREVIIDNGRKQISSDLFLGDDGKYHIDFEDFERKIVENQVKLFFLCSPHNPVSRVWTKEELIRIGDICLKHNVIVVSDEIHQDFVYEGNKHYVFATLKPEYREISVVCTSPGKTFNLAGLQISNIFIANQQLRKRFQKQMDAIGYSQLNTMGITACTAAYLYGDEWYQAMLTYLKGNIEYVRTYLTNHIPQIKMIEPEGTYLIWLDFRNLQLSKWQQRDLVVNRAKLWLDRGEMFGAAGEGFERVNIACPRKILNEALHRLERALKE